MTTSATHEYRCVIGFDHVPAKGKALRFEPGDTVTGLPAGVLRALAEADDPAVEAKPVEKPAAKRKRGDA